MIRMKLDVATLRVVYFTHNQTEKLSSAAQILDYDYEGELPEGMTLDNCWNWTLRGNKLVNTEISQSSKNTDLLHHNKKEVRNFLVNKLDNLRNTELIKLGGEYLFLKYIEKELNDDTSEFIQQLAKAKNLTRIEFIDEFTSRNTRIEQIIKTTMINKVYYERLINLAADNEVLYKIREEIEKKDLSIAQMEH